jgi:hypothetical protein
VETEKHKSTLNYYGTSKGVFSVPTRQNLTEFPRTTTTRDDFTEGYYSGVASEVFEVDTPSPLHLKAVKIAHSGFYHDLYPNPRKTMPEAVKHCYEKLMSEDV